MSDLITYAIGDIHGCGALLVRLLRDIRDHTADRCYRLVFLGDYIDRGPESASVVRIVRELQKVDASRVICLKGNHEDMLLQAVADPEKVAWWLESGGATALTSFGVPAPRNIPREVLEWIAALPTSYEDERRIYVHAGLAPGRLLAEQSDRDKLWIREPFLTSRFAFGKHVVHGHTPLVFGKPDVRENAQTWTQEPPSAVRSPRVCLLVIKKRPSSSCRCSPHPSSRKDGAIGCKPWGTGHSTTPCSSAIWSTRV